MREKAGVPLVYINRSVMIMEPMAAKTEEVRDQDEISKFRAGLKGRRGGPLVADILKRKRDDDQEDEDEDSTGDGTAPGATQVAQAIPKKRRKGPKEPNPLSVKKVSKKPVGAVQEDMAKTIRRVAKDDPQSHEKATVPGAASTDTATDDVAKRKRKRRHKTATGAPETEA